MVDFRLEERKLTKPNSDGILRGTCGFLFLSLNPEGVTGALCIMILSMMGKAIFLLLKSDLKGLKSEKEDLLMN